MQAATVAPTSLHQTSLPTFCHQSHIPEDSYLHIATIALSSSKHRATTVDGNLEVKQPLSADVDEDLSFVPSTHSAAVQALGKRIRRFGSLDSPAVQDLTSPLCFCTTIDTIAPLHHCFRQSPL